MRVDMNKFPFLVFAVVALVLTLSSGCVGYVLGGSNLGYGGYPSFNGYEPSAPFTKEPYAVDMYRSEVESYKQEAENYIENAENDIQMIQEAISDAIYDVNRVVDEYNLFITSLY
jgi:peptidoglycan hydrolase CwlO-like protein